jgi:lipoyl(octanoyl) transferase
VSNDAQSPRKIASIGVHARDWVTWHGFALNVTTDLGYFDLMVPCGIEAVEMTSVSRELATPAADRDSLGGVVRAEVVRAFGEVFSLETVSIGADMLPPIVTPGAIAS